MPYVCSISTMLSSYRMTVCHMISVHNCCASGEDLLLCDILTYVNGAKQSRLSFFSVERKHLQSFHVHYVRILIKYGCHADLWRVTASF